MTKELNLADQARVFKTSRAAWFTQNYGDVDERTKGRITNALDVREQLDAGTLTGVARKQALRKLFTLALSVVEAKNKPFAGQVLFNRLQARPNAAPAVISPTPGVTADTVHQYSPGVRAIERNIAHAERDLAVLKTRQKNPRKQLPDADRLGLYPVASVLEEFSRKQP